MEDNPRNEYLDPELDYIYNLEKLNTTHFYLQNNWLSQLNPPRILVTGAHSWMAHYILYLLTYYSNHPKILGIDTTTKPEYLTTPRYQKVEYTPLQDKFKDLQETIQTFQPHLIFHCDYIWNIQEKNITKLYETNVWQVDLLCQAAKKANVQRIICYTDSTIYYPHSTIETVPTTPYLSLGKSFRDAEKITEQYHSLDELQIYHLRLAPMYGPNVPHGIMLLARLIIEGLLLGPIGNMPEKISLLHAYDFALASYFIALAPVISHRILNVAAPSLPLKQLLDTIAKNTPRKKILGITTSIANILRLGYQSEITIPSTWNQCISQYSEHSTRLLNQLRFHKHIPLLHKDTNTYIQTLPEFNTKKWNDNIAWQPKYNQDELLHSIQYALQHTWNMKETIERPEIHQIYPLIDELTKLTDSLENYTPQENEEPQFLTIPLYNFQIDRKSLWILLDRTWNFVRNYIFQKNKVNANLNYTKIFSHFKQNILNIIRYENENAKRRYPNNPQEQRYWISNRIGGVNHARVKKYIYIFILEELLLSTYQKYRQYHPLIQLLPEKNFGILIHSDIGDIAIHLIIKDNQLVPYFARTEIESIPKTYDFQKRLQEYHKINKLHLTVGLDLDKFLYHLTTPNPLKTIYQNIGKDYILSQSPDYYKLLGQAINKTEITTYLFTNQNRKIQFGIQLQDKKWVMMTEEYIQMINTLYENISNQNQVIDIIQKTTNTQITFFKIQTIRKLISGIITPTKIKKIIIKLLIQSKK
ncbi:MAG TPA: NAD(P)-dependent oxidoreductase [Planctomycetota bacterium]|nr:NAD(P)-dependent oxidoreductase [Planctomycetota bacterium]HQA99823.1 NAD(P)-dependent oxidoreductase [Planctomycetota bacterium]